MSVGGAGQTRSPSEVPNQGRLLAEIGEAWRYVTHVMHDRLDHLFQHCADLEVDVEWADLGAIRHGEYDLRADVIVLHVALTRRQTVACLAHELGHRRFGDDCSTPANERRAWEYGAALTIGPEEYRQAEAVVGSDARDLAAELEVTPKLVKAWRWWWEKRGQYLSRVDLDPLGSEAVASRAGQQVDTLDY